MATSSDPLTPSFALTQQMIRLADKPNPGSDEAYEAGCACDRETNGDGDGGLLGLFVFNTCCPLHFPEGDDE